MNNRNLNPSGLLSNPISQMQQLTNGMTINVDNSLMIPDNMQIIQRVLDNQTDIRYFLETTKQTENIQRLLASRQSYDHNNYQKSQFYKTINNCNNNISFKELVRRYNNGIQSLFSNLNTSDPKIQHLWEAYQTFCQWLINPNPDIWNFMIGKGLLTQQELTKLITVIEATVSEQKSNIPVHIFNITRQFFVYLYQQFLMGNKIDEFNKTFNLMKQLLLNHHQSLNNMMSNMTKLDELSKHLHMNEETLNRYQQLIANLTNSIQLAENGNTAEIARLSQTLDDLSCLVSNHYSQFMQNKNVVENRFNAINGDLSQIRENLNLVNGRLNEIDIINDNMNSLQNSLNNRDKDGIHQFMADVKNVLNQINNDKLLTEEKLQWLYGQWQQASMAYDQMSANLSNLSNLSQEQRNQMSADLSNFCNYQQNQYNQNANSLTTAVNEIVNELKSSVNTLKDNYNQQYIQTNNDFANLKNEMKAIPAILNMIKQLKSDAENATSNSNQLNQLSEQVKGIVKDMNNCIDQIKQVKTEMNAITSQMNNLQNQFNIMQENSTTMSQRMSNLEQIQQNSSMAIDNLNTNIDGMNTTLTGLNGDVTNLNNRFQDISTQFSHLEEELNEVRNQMSSNANHADFNNLTQNISQLNSTMQNLARNTNVLRPSRHADHEDIDEDVAMLDEQMEELKTLRDLKRMNKLIKTNELIELDNDYRLLKKMKKLEKLKKLKKLEKLKSNSELPEHTEINQIGMEEIPNQLNEIKQDDVLTCQQPPKYKYEKPNITHTLNDIRLSGQLHKFDANQNQNPKPNKSYIGTPGFTIVPEEIKDFRNFVNENKAMGRNSVLGRMWLMKDWFPKMNLIDKFDVDKGAYTLDEYIIKGLQFLGRIERECGDYDSNNKLNVVTFKAAHLINMFSIIKFYNFDDVALNLVETYEEQIISLFNSLMGYKESCSCNSQACLQTIAVLNSVIDDCYSFLQGLISEIQNLKYTVVSNNGLRDDDYIRIRTLVSRIIQSFPKDVIPKDSVEINVQFFSDGYRTFKLDRSSIPKYSNYILHSVKHIPNKYKSDLELKGNVKDPNFIQKALNSLLFILNRIETEKKGINSINSNQSNKTTIKKSSKKELKLKPEPTKSESKKSESKKSIKTDNSKTLNVTTPVYQYCYAHN